MKKPLALDAAEIDWNLLRQQKADLNEALVSGAPLTPKARFSVSGIIELLDYMQDEAAKVLGESDVLGRQPAQSIPKIRPLHRGRALSPKRQPSVQHHKRNP